MFLISFPIENQLIFCLLSCGLSGEEILGKMVTIVELAREFFARFFFIRNYSYLKINCLLVREILCYVRVLVIFPRHELSPNFCLNIRSAKLIVGEQNVALKNVHENLNQTKLLDLTVIARPSLYLQSENSNDTGVFVLDLI